MKNIQSYVIALVTVVSILLSGTVSAQSNNGFELGNLNNWTSGGGTSSTIKSTGWSPDGVGVAVTTGITNYSPGGGKTWTIRPYGTYMASVQPGGGSVTFDSAVSSLGLTGTENTAIKSYLTYQANNGGGGNPTPTNASWVRQTVTLQAGVTYSFAWNYLSTDYTPWNDGSMMTLVHATDASKIPTLNNSVQRYALLGFTNPGTGNYATGSYGSTGWQVAVFTVPESGNYIMGFAAFNLGDTALSPILLIDEIQGTTLLNGSSFGPIAPNPGSTAPTTPTAPSLCCGATSTSFSAAPLNQIKIDSYSNRHSADSKVYIEQVGSFNTIIVQQTGTKNNYTKYVGAGDNNNITVTQSSTSNTASNYVDLFVNGSSNTVNMTQNSTGGFKSAFVSISSNNNSLTLSQQNNGSHYADITLTGGNKSVSLTQSGGAGHMASITLSGLPVSLNLTQAGSTTQYYSINYNCATAGGCPAITVTQGP